MELKLAGSARNQLEQNTKDLIGKLASVLSARATRFNGMFHLSAHTHAFTLTHSHTAIHIILNRTILLYNGY